MDKTHLRNIGTSLGVILSKEVLARHNMEKGDALFITHSPSGITLRNTDPEFEEQMQVARKIMKKRSAVLRELAK